MCTPVLEYAIFYVIDHTITGKSITAKNQHIPVFNTIFYKFRPTSFHSTADISCNKIIVRMRKGLFNCDFFVIYQLLNIGMIFR